MAQVKSNKSIAIIPARWASSRFPGKPLALLAGKPVIQHVYERTSQTAALQEVLVATDDQRIYDAVLAFGGKVRMTRSDHATGTDRITELARELLDAKLIVNVQGDEPFIRPQQIEAVLRPLQEGRAPISTLATPIRSTEELHNPNVVKLVQDQQGRALYFSRSPIPHLRDYPFVQWIEHQHFLKHLGIYGFQREVLVGLESLPQGTLERAEQLEQLRWLEAGYSIAVGHTEEATLGIDSPEDLERANRHYHEQ